MGLTALTVTILCYAIAAVDLARKGDVLMALVWACYAVANAALTKASFGKEIDAIVRAWL